MKKIDLLVEEFRAKYESFIIGCDSIEEIDRWNKEEYGEMDVYYENELLSIILRLIAADNEISNSEVEYINRVFGFECTLESVCEMLEECHGFIGDSFDEGFVAGIRNMQSINGKLASAYKELILLVCSIITESDGLVRKCETEAIEKIRAMCTE